MAVSHTDATRNAVADFITGLIGSGGKLKYRLPGTVNSPGTVVATLSLSSTPFTPAVAGVATANTITEDASATGSATPVATATLEKGDGTIIAHCTIKVTGGDINMTGGLVIEPADKVRCGALSYCPLVQ